ncbi:hypothetical protein [Microbacterium sp. zg-YB36]|uniref:hypothetical protein n=1 Tax=Microbacterium sp. zg-YB36 TaxID=2969407 RepID=UPI00214C9A67|nr:hypothetical protein [Microbacterium sp. zg-YB36]MDL5351584.1 hypothetical protein [Microbacterium sp. zg-YB36]
MSSLATSLPDQAFVPLTTPLDPYHDVFWEVESEPELGLTPRTKMLALPAIALATLELHAAPAKTWRPTTRGLVTEASIRAAIWKDRRGYSLSAYEMALNFQALFFHGDGRRGGNMPLLGLDVLRGIDRLSVCGTQLWCSMPTSADPFEFETVRLTTALKRVAPRAALRMA